MGKFKHTCEKQTELALTNNSVKAESLLKQWLAFIYSTQTCWVITKCQAFLPINKPSNVSNKTNMMFSSTQVLCSLNNRKLYKAQHPNLLVIFPKLKQIVLARQMLLWIDFLIKLIELQKQDVLLSLCGYTPHICFIYSKCWLLCQVCDPEHGRNLSLHGTIKMTQEDNNSEFPGRQQISSTSWFCCLLDCTETL